MHTYHLFATTSTASSTASLATWLRRQGQSAEVAAADGTMGSGETVSAVLAGTAALRAFLLVAREWIRAHRTTITMEIEGRGRFVVEGTTDVDELVRLLEGPSKGGDIG